MLCRGCKRARRRVAQKVWKNNHTFCAGPWLFDKDLKLPRNNSLQRKSKCASSQQSSSVSTLTSQALYRTYGSRGLALTRSLQKPWNSFLVQKATKIPSILSHPNPAETLEICPGWESEDDCKCCSLATERQTWNALVREPTIADSGRATKRWANLLKSTLEKCLWHKYHDTNHSRWHVRAWPPSPFALHAQGGSLPWPLQQSLMSPAVGALSATAHCTAPPI